MSSEFKVLCSSRISSARSRRQLEKELSHQGAAVFDAHRGHPGTDLPRRAPPGLARAVPRPETPRVHHPSVSADRAHLRDPETLSSVMPRGRDDRSPKPAAVIASTGGDGPATAWRSRPGHEHFGAPFDMQQREFAKRRQRLMDMMGDGSIAIVPTSPVRQRNRDVSFPFRPESSFYYLTGFGEPEAVAVLSAGRRGGSVRDVLPGTRPQGGTVDRRPSRARGGVRATRRGRRVSHHRLSTTSSPE